MGDWGFMYPLTGLVLMVMVLFLYFGSRSYPMQGGHYDEVEDLRRQISELKKEIQNLKERENESKRRNRSGKE